MHTYLIPALPFLAFLCIYSISLALAVRSLRKTDGDRPTRLTNREAILLIVCDGIFSRLKTELDKIGAIARIDLRFFMVVGLALCSTAIYLSQSTTAKIVAATFHASSLLALLILWQRWRTRFSFRQITVLHYFRYDQDRFGSVGKTDDLTALKRELTVAFASIVVVVSAVAFALFANNG